jgi:hypothetical protein
MKTLQDLVDKTLCEHTAPDLALGYLRYEALRCVNGNQWHALRERNMAGERFDDMIDELVKEKGNKP